MAKRSDFAQKLLDDLRSRKERMATSQSSNHSNSLPGDAYAYSKQTYRGSRNTKTQVTTGYKSGNTNNRSSGGKKSLTSQEASSQIVPFGRGQSSEQIGDLSMALAFALENGGKLGRIDSSGNNSVLGFLKQIGRRSIDYGKIESRSIVDHRSSSSRVPTLSHLHIKEISKGAQKLNQILRSCSNGLNFDRYSIEIGKELLKGAIDLEESLRMLVNLQEASEYMVSPQRKNRITLLEDDEDDDDNTAQLTDQKQLDRPRFSFDKPSRNYHNIQEVARSEIKQRVMALTYSSEATNFNQGNQALITSNLVSHKRSASYSPGVKTLATFSDQKNHSVSLQSKQEKGRIPNVIAKLMGLDELPGNVDSKHTTHKDSNSKQKTEGMVSKKAPQASTKKSEKRSKDTENMAPPPVKQKEIQTRKLPAIQDTTLALIGENLLTHNGSFEVVVHSGKPPPKDFEGIKPVTGSKKAAVNIDKQQSNITQLNRCTGSQKDIQEKERKQDNTKHREPKGTSKGETEEPGLKDQLQQMAQQTHKRSENAVMFKEKTGSKESTLQIEKRYSNKLVLGNQQKSQNDLRIQQPRMQRKSEPQEEFHQAEEREQQSAKQKMLGRKQKGSELISNNLSKPMYDSINSQMKQPPINQDTASKRTSIKVISAMRSEKFPNGRNHEDLVTDGSSTSSNVNLNDSPNMDSNHYSTPRDVESVPAKAKNGTPPAVEEKSVQVLAAQKAKNTKVNKSETPRRIDEVMTRRNGTLQSFARPLKDQSSNLQEVKQRRPDKLSGSKEAEKLRLTRSKDAEARIVKSNKSIPSIPPLKVAQQPKREAQQASILYSPVENECQLLEEPQALAPTDSHQNIISRVTNDKQDQAPIIGRDEEFKSCKIVSNPLDGTHEGSTDISYPSKLKHHIYSKSETPEPLTESEIHLKQTLIKSQIFLNTAEALFKLNIPVAILHADGLDNLDEECSLILDCGYEVMRRKGRRQELSVHPCMKVSITSMKVRYLDDLVKQLHKEFEKLKFYGRNGNAECLVEDYLPKMLESDVHNKDPDVNCMWDLGWNEMMNPFLEKDDVIKDVEKIVLNGLIDEITRELIHMII